jgi:hypothetical protein
MFSDGAAIQLLIVMLRNEASVPGAFKKESTRMMYQEGVYVGFKDPSFRLTGKNHCCREQANS